MGRLTQAGGYIEKLKEAPKRRGESKGDGMEFIEGDFLRV